MTPKEKAKELVAKFKSNVYKKAFANTDFMYDRYYGLDDDMSIQCALIAVDEILNVINKNDVDIWDIDILKYWREVKQEIENL